MNTPEQIVNGLSSYIDNEIISKMDTPRKWIMGTMIGLAKNNASKVVQELQQNTMVRSLGIVTADGLFDVDLIAKNLKDSAERYGKVQMDIPIIGTITLSSEDVDLLKSYIQG